ncbi:MAG: hypothetical protein AAB066_03925 [Candidatus Margulisiibacteriota bacterium]
MIDIRRNENFLIPPLYEKISGFQLGLTPKGELGNEGELNKAIIEPLAKVKM